MLQRWHHRSLCRLVLPALLLFALPLIAAASTNNLFTDRLAIQVASNGRFNLGAFPDPLTGDAAPTSWDLMFNWPNEPSTSFTTIRIDGTDYIYGTDGTQEQAPINSDARTNTSQWRIDGVDVTQTLELVRNPLTGRDDAARIAYTLRNTTSTPRSVGVRVMLDTQINDDDGAPFRLPGQGIFTTERALTDDAIPDSFQVFFRVDDSERVAGATLRGSDQVTPPDRLVPASWPRIMTTMYDFTPDPTVSFGDTGSDDSAYAVYWNPVTLAPDTETTYATLYGLADLDADLRPPLALAVSGPATLSIADNQYTPNPFALTATVLNNGTVPATGVQVTLNLTGTTGLTLVSGAETQSIGDLAVGEERQVTWYVAAAPQGRIEPIAYAVVADADNADPKTVVRDIVVPALAGVPPPYTRSWYVFSPDTEPNRQLGCQARERGERGVMILLFGSPRELSIDAQGETIYGTQLLTGSKERIRLAQIATTVEAFARGYARGCNAATPTTVTGLQIAVGTTNSKIGGVDNPALTADHGVAWAEMINQLNRTLLSDYDGAVLAVGGYDAEQGLAEWSSPPPTRAWAQGYSSAAGYIYYNFGDATAAPRNEPRENWTDGSVTSTNFPHLPALELAYELSDGLPFARSLPQIYKAEFAYEWYNVKRYAQEQGENMFISGVTTSCGPVVACDFTDTSDWTKKVGTNAFLTPDQGWYALYETMNAQFTPEVDQATGESLQRPNPVEQRLLPFVTDFANGAG
jgi:hypothetical protein